MPIRLVACLLLSAFVVVACDRSAQSANGEATALPPGMTRAGNTNNLAVPPAVPYDAATPRIEARAVSSYAHDTAAYTQGLLIFGQRLIESTGLEGKSEVREVERSTGRVQCRTSISASMFGEGIATLRDRLYQITWLHHRGYVYDVTRLAVIDSFSYEGEGWGLTSDGSRLYLSDGTSTVRVINPSGFAVERTFQVREGNRSVWMLNELEWVRGELWANVYTTNLIARIDPNTGYILGWLDVGSLLTAGERTDVRAREGVANGIAFDSVQSRILITGKRWPRIFEIDLNQLISTAPKSR